MKIQLYYIDHCKLQTFTDQYLTFQQQTLNLINPIQVQFAD